MIPPPSFSCTLASRSPLLSSPKRLQKPLQRSLTGLGRAGRPLPLPTAHLPAHRPEPRPCGRCRLRGSSRRSQTPTPDTGASECPLGPSPTLCVIHVLVPWRLSQGGAKCCQTSRLFQGLFFFYAESRTGAQQLGCAGLVALRCVESST